LKLFAFAFFLRFLLFETNLSEQLRDRVEIVTPLTSWNRLKECIALSYYNLSPYSGDACHHTPLLIVAFKFLDGNAPFIIPVLFILLDIVGAYQLMKAAKLFILKEIKSQKRIEIKDDAKVLLIKDDDASKLPYLVAIVYLYNPFTVATCAALSTSSIVNFLLCTTVYFQIQGYHYAAAILLSLPTCISLYPIMLLVPILLHSVASECRLLKLLKVAVVFIASLSCLLLLSYKLYETWEFFNAVYIFILKVPDLTPNMGLFWYFFLEMFDHFRLFFLWVLQLHAFVYLIPFTIMFRKHPVFLFYILLSTISWSKSYPSVSDLILPLAILPLWSCTFRYFRSLFVTIVMLIFSTLLSPFLYHLWVYAGSGNANFFYAATLAFNLAQVLLLSDVIYGFRRREFHLKHGLCPETEHGEKGRIVMK